jgi:hypothetical protein
MFRYRRGLRGVEHRQFVIGNNLLNSSLVPIKALDSGVNPTSGFVFVNGAGFRTTSGLGPPRRRRLSLPSAYSAGKSA